MKPPPPMLPAEGWVTAKAKLVATAASTAFPPLASTDAPASHAGAETQTTRPSFDDTPRSWAPGFGWTTSREIATRIAVRVMTSSSLRRGCRGLRRGLLPLVEPVPQVQLRPEEVRRVARRPVPFVVEPDHGRRD